MSAEDEAIRKLQSQQAQASAAAEDRLWALEQAKALIHRYVRSLTAAGRQPATVARPTYSLEQYENKTGPFWSRYVDKGHRWTMTEQNPGKGWPVLWTLGWAQFTRDAIVDRDRDVLGYSAPNVVVCTAETSELKLGVVADSSRDLRSSDYSGAARAALDSRKVWVEPEAHGQLCSHGWCGLPIWVSDYVNPDQLNSDPENALRIRGTHEDIEFGPTKDSVTRVEAPRGRGQDSYDWYMRDLLAVLNLQLSTMGVAWA